MAIAVDQASIGTRTSDPAAASITLTTTAAVASNGFIVLAMGRFGSNLPITSVTGGGLTWNVEQDATAFGGGTAVSLLWAQAPAGLASSTVITMNFSAADPQAFALGAMSLTGVKTATPVELSGVMGIPPTPDGNPWSSGSRSISAGSVLIACNYTADTGAGNSPTSPSLEAWEATDVVDVYGCAMVYRIEASAGSVASGGQWAGTGGGATAYAAFLAAPAGGPTDTTSRRYEIRRSRATSW